MSKIILMASLLVGAVGCEVYIYEEHPPHNYDVEYCDEQEPYHWSAEMYRDYYDGHGYYEGTCGEWYTGQGWYEEWCNWYDVCGWEFVAEYHTH